MRRQLELSNEAAAVLGAPGDGVLRAIEEHARSSVFLRGNVLTLDGDDAAVDHAAEVVREVSELIGGYLPAGLSDAELRTIVERAVADAGAQSPRDMGKVMKTVLPVVDGRADGGRVSREVKAVLGG